MDRLALAVIATSFATFLASSYPAPAHAEQRAPEERCQESEDVRCDTSPMSGDKLLVDLRMDNGRAHGFGIGGSYIMDEGAIFLSVGANLGISGESFGSADGFVAEGITRMLTVAGFSSEIGLGVGRGSGKTHPIAHVGGFFSFYFIDLGYTYRPSLGPLKTPQWLSPHQFSLRVHVPVLSL